MKKIMTAFLAVAILVALVATPVFAGNGNGKFNGNGADKSPGIDFNGPHYNLNIVGKKLDWSGGGSYDNWDRHTMFVPEYTTDMTIPTPGDDGTTNVPDLDGIKIEMSQGSEWAVLDGNAFDEINDGDPDTPGTCSLQLPPGTYHVYIVAKAKPAKPGEDRYTDINGWVYAEDEYGAAYYYNIGDVRVTKSKKWWDITDMFYVSPGEDYFGIIGSDMWVFEYLNYLTGYDFGDDPDITDAAYFWQFDNNGNKLVKVRFYPD